MKGKVWLDSFTDESATDRRYQEARKKVDVVIHPEWPPGRVDARTPVTIKLGQAGLSPVVTQLRNVVRPYVVMMQALP
jgi:2-methylcitrate dehydratase PrpD